MGCGVGLAQQAAIGIELLVGRPLLAEKEVKCPVVRALRQISGRDGKLHGERMVLLDGEPAEPLPSVHVGERAQRQLGPVRHDRVGVLASAQQRLDHLHPLIQQAFQLADAQRTEHLERERLGGDPAGALEQAVEHRGAGLRPYLAQRVHGGLTLGPLERGDQITKHVRGDRGGSQAGDCRHALRLPRLHHGRRHMGTQWCMQVGQQRIELFLGRFRH
ncbi:hypothetical protein D3C72_942840 [compost metagenome]